MRRDCQYLPEGEQVVRFAVCVRTSVGCLLEKKTTVCKESTACTLNIVNYWAKLFIWPLWKTQVVI